MKLPRNYQRGAAMLLLPASVVPFVIVGPQLVESRLRYDREHNSGPLPAPAVTITPALKKAWAPPPALHGKIPVLVYHGIDSGSSPGQVTQTEFARQMAMLRTAGFRTITTDAYVRFRNGDSRGLPPRPILITFDGGRLDTFRGADKVLQGEGFSATMFVTADQINRQNDRYLMWRELKAMENTGRWDIQAGAAEGRRMVAITDDGRHGPAYAYRRFTRSTGTESFADWQRRVTDDVFAARSAMVAHGFQPQAFAVPFGSYGQRGTNDRRIAPTVRMLISAQFGVGFTEGRGPRVPFTTRHGEPERYDVGRRTSAGRLYAWLRDGSQEPSA